MKGGPELSRDELLKVANRVLVVGDEDPTKIGIADPTSPVGRVCSEVLRPAVAKALGLQGR